MTMVLLNLLHNLMNISVVASNTLLFVTFKLVGVLFQSTFKFGVCAVGSMLVVISEGAHVLVVQVHEHLDPLFLSLHQLTVDLLSDMGESLFDLTDSSGGIFLCYIKNSLSYLFVNDVVLSFNALEKQELNQNNGLFSLKRSRYPINWNKFKNISI